MKTISRFFFILIGLNLITLSPLSAQAEEKAKILIIATKLDHAWDTHMYSHECKMLAKCLNQNEGVEAIVSPQLDWPEDEALLEGVRSIVYYSRPAGDVLLAPERRDKVRALFKSGVGYAAIHWSTGANMENGDNYLDMLGGWFNFKHSSLKVDRRPLVFTAEDHPIYRGWEEYELRDEFYKDLKFHPDAQPLVKVNVDGKDQVLTWVLERKDSNNGRSFGTTLGHFHDNFGIESFRRAIVNGILWSAHVEIPEGGAKVDVEPSDLVLPPKPADAK